MINIKNHIIEFKDDRYNINLGETNLFKLIQKNNKNNGKCEININGKNYSFIVKRREKSKWI